MNGCGRILVLSVCTLSLCTATLALAEGTQQNRMKQCHAEAGDKGLKGDERKAFMKSCLSTKSVKENMSEQKK